MGMISFITAGFSRLENAIGKKIRDSQSRERAKEIAEFERQLENQLELIPQRNKTQEILSKRYGFHSLKVEPTSLKDHLHISGEIAIIDYKKYKDALNEVFKETNQKLSPSFNAEILGRGVIRISQFLRVVSA